MTELVDLVTRSLSAEAASEFEDRVETQAASLEAALDAGELENEDFTVGMEMEVYAVTDFKGATDDGPDSDGVSDSRDNLDSDSVGTPHDESSQLARLPASVFESGAGKELGLHNAEINTDPDVLNEEGLASQAARIERQFETAQKAAREAGCRLVLDAMWVLPPAEGSYEYVANVEEREGVTVAGNMRPDPRYVAIDNASLAGAGGAIPFEVPGATHEFPSILFESLATSIQPHLQLPDTETLPEYYNAAIRTLGPVLALSTNSPFLPPDLYNAVEDSYRLVEETPHELRIAVFEQSVNQTPNDKVCVPGDVDETSETLDRIVADDLCAPFLREWLVDEPRESFADRHWEFTYKRSTYWRWVRCVVGGDPVDSACDERSVRIEYRPLPTQPAVTDVVALQSLVVGLLHGLVVADHPLPSLPWDAAERSFYSAAEKGPEADLAWVTADGDRTDETAVIFEELFEFARLGLDAAGVPTSDIETYLAPLEARRKAGLTPSAWKKDRVREGLDDGFDLATAIEMMQREYVERSRESESFAAWL